MREQYSKELKNLNDEILSYGAMAEQILDMAINSLINQDMNLALDVMNLEKEMDVREVELENQCLEILALQQPMAKDLRLISSIIRMISDIERIGDLSENIAETTIKIGKDKFIKPLIDIPKMADMCKTMIKMALDCYVKEDVSGAYKVFTMDDVVDNVFKDISTEILYLINKDINFIHQGMQLILVSRYLERIADHTTNICEGVNYIVTGNRKFN